jgi:hypothetical protein
MAQAQGSNTPIVMQVESSFGVAPTPDARLLYYLKCDLVSEQNLLRSQVMSNNRNPRNVVQGNIDVKGSITTELSPENGLLLKSALGTLVTTGAGPYVHTLTIGALSSFIIEQQFNDISIYNRFLGCKCGGFDMTINAEGIPEMKFDFLGASQTFTTVFDASPRDLGHTPFSSFNIGTIQEGGSGIAIVTGIKGLKLKNKLDGNQYHIGGAGVRGRIPVGMVSEVSGEVETFFENTTLLAKALAGTESSLKVIFTRGDGLGSAGNESIEFLVPELKFKLASPKVDTDMGLMVSLGFEGYYANSTEASAMQIIIKNAVSTIV